MHTTPTPTSLQTHAIDTDDMLATSAAGLSPTLTSHDYCSTEIYELERERIFHAGWMYVCHVDGLAPGTRRSFEIAGESVIVTRDADGAVRAFANVCRHRGAQLCPASSAEPVKGSIRCPYHAWTYGLDGALLATPRVDDEFERADYHLWHHHAEIWNGLVFVSVADEPQPLQEWLAATTPSTADFSGVPIADYRIGARTETVVAANWKILIENYNECLHCAVVHPELVAVIPVYRTGHVVDPERSDEIVAFRAGARALTIDGESTLSVLPGVGDAAEYSGVAVFPNLELDITPTALVLTTLFPVAPDTTVVVAEYLFAASDVERSDFDPAAEVDFNELVGAQDFVVCETVQRGVSSRSFAGGGLTAKDAYVTEFVARYLDIRGAAATH
jgi:glycine betaine catabolism A